MTARETKAKYFQSGGEFRAWLESNHDRASELLVGFYKKSASKTGITYPRRAGRGAGVRMDRRRSSRGGRRAVHDPIHAAEGAKHLEQREREASGRAHRRRANARSGSRDIRASATAERSGIYSYEREPVELDAAAMNALKARSSGVGLSRETAAGVPAAGGPLGDAGKEAGNPRASLASTHRERAGGKTDSVAGVVRVILMAAPAAGDLL